MSAFTTCAPPRAASPDPTKRVNYTHGLVLSASEYVQESAYHSGRTEELVRAVLGYGTAIGLTVQATTIPDRGAAIVVGSGLALSPRGRPIRLPIAHAVHLNEWLESERGAFFTHLRPGADSPPNDVLQLFLVLAPCACVTDNVPGPGEPCRSDEPPARYTRIADSFRLELRYEPPSQIEEDAVRGFVTWVRSVELTTSELDALTIDEFLDALRAASVLASPPGESLASPPGVLRIPAARAADYYAAAFRVWIGEIRTSWRAGATGPAACADSTWPDDAILLAEISVPLAAQPDGRWVVDETASIEIREERRPYLLHLRLLQEWMTGGERRASGAHLAAAGIVRGDVNGASHRRPLVNGLRVTGVADGELTFSFDDYTPPASDGAFQYIVKALCGVRQVTGPPAVVALAGFRPAGIALRVTDAQGTALPVAELGSLEISLEVTRHA